jgi:hypothetical protein
MTTPDERNLLREDVLREITQRIAEVDFSDKDAARRAHLPAVSVAREAARPALERWESELVGQFAFPSDIRPDRIRPQLIPVRH